MKNYIQKVKTIFLVLLALTPAVLASLPLFGRGFIPTHDGEYHLLRFEQFYRMLQAGYWFPRWAPTLNSGYGIPLFNFHYPFPNYIGSLFHFLGWSFVDSFKLTLALGYMLSSLFCFLWIEKLFNKKAALVATIIFSYIPYWFVELYVRGSVGEVLAITFVMMSLIAMEYQRPTLLAFSLALIILSHNILAIVFLPILIGYILLRQRGYLKSIILGIGLSAYFWLPALLERKYVVGLNTVDFRDHFPALYQLLVPSWGTGFSVKEFSYDEMSYQIGVLPLLIILLFMLRLFLQKIVKLKQLNLFILFLMIMSFFMMLEVSLPVWNSLAFFQYLQYPWRLLIVFLVTTTYAAGFLTFYFKHLTYGVSLAILAVLFAYSYAQPVIYAPRSDEYYLSKKEFTDGTSSMGNTFSTIWTGWKDTRPLSKLETLEGDPQILTADEQLMSSYFRVFTNVLTKVRLNTLYYPGWSVYVDGKRSAIDYEKDGTLIFAIPQGEHLVTIRFEETSIRKLANSLSVICLLWIVISSILKIVYAYRYRYHAAL